MGSAVMDQVVEARQAVQEARDQEGAGGGTAAGGTGERQQALLMKCRGWWRRKWSCGGCMWSGGGRCTK